MRRIYESGALARDEHDAFAPGAREDDATPQAMRSVPGRRLSRLLVPQGVVRRALSVTVETPEREFERGQPVPVRVTLSNPLPVPVTVSTRSPRLWTWAVDGVDRASHVDRAGTAEAGSFVFDRGERKRFTRRWHQSFRVSQHQWEPVGVGEYEISAALNVPDPESVGLAATTTVRVVD